ncbi:MAG: hypothetical protein RLY93_17080 [Sumerlaeia bacterium]
MELKKVMDAFGCHYAIGYILEPESKSTYGSPSTPDEERFAHYFDFPSVHDAFRLVENKILPLIWSQGQYTAVIVRPTEYSLLALIVPKITDITKSYLRSKELEAALISIA